MTLPPLAADYLPVPGSLLYYGSLFVAAEQKPGLHALLALKAEVTEIPKTSSDPGVAQLKLQWWIDEAQRLCTQQPLRHPITKTIRACCPQVPFSLPEFTSLAEAVMDELHGPRFANYAALKDHVTRGSGRFLALSAYTSGAAERVPPLADLIELSTQLELASALQKLQWYRQHGYLPLPADEIPPQPLGPGQDLSPEWQAFFRRYTQRLRNELANSTEALQGQAPDNSTHLFVLHAMQLALLDEVLRDGCRLLTHRIELTPLRMFWIAWRAQRRLRKGFP